MLIALHDGSGRDIEVERHVLKTLVDCPRLGDRFRFRLHIDTKSGKLSATDIAWLAPGETINAQ
jgi:hypothetical protein